MCLSRSYGANEQQPGFFNGILFREAPRSQARSRGEAFIAFGEPLTLPLILGTVVVVTGVYLTNRRSVQAIEA